MLGVAAPSIAQDYARSVGDSAYPQVWDGQVGAWATLLGQTGAKLFDVSGRRHDGVLTNMDPATDWVSSASEKLSGDVLELDAASSQYISLGDLGVAEGPAFTYLTWIVTTQTGNDRWGLSEGSDIDDQPIFGLINQDSVARFFLRDNGSTQVNLISSFTINDGEPHCLVGVAYNLGSHALFVDGVLRVADTSTTLGAISVDTASIGALDRASVGQFSTQQASISMFFDRALSIGEIELLYERPLAPWERKRRIIRRAPVVAPGGRIMSSLVSAGGLAGMGGIAGQGGGLAA